MEIELEDDPAVRFDADEMKEYLSGKLYTSLAEFHNAIEEASDTIAANDIIITALSINLGHIIGQLPPKSRKYAMRSMKKIVEDQMSEVAKMTDIQNYGQIGHA